MLDTARIKVLAFDVFGTVVDWHSGIAAEVDAMASPGIQGAKFARQWRAGYRPAMDQVLSGELPWMNVDALHRVILDRLLAEHRIEALDEASRCHLNKAWHRLAAWPEAVEGLSLLRRKYMVSTLSNGNIGLLADMAKHAGLP